MSGPERQIKRVEQLPKAKHRDDWTVSQGYAVNLVREGQDDWYFFRHLEPAWIFLRTARMGERIEGEVCVAAYETRFDNATEMDKHTLHVGQTVWYWDVDEAKLVAYFANHQIDQKSKFPAAAGQPLSAYLVSNPEGRYYGTGYEIRVRAPG